MTNARQPVIFGLLLIRGNAMMRAAVLLLTGISVLDMGTVVGGFLFLLALVPLSVAFLRMDAEAEWTP